MRRLCLTTVGTQQGAVISALLDNVYLHDVLDLWIQGWRSQRGPGDMVIVRYANDFNIGVEYKYATGACLKELRDRFAKFSVNLHEQKPHLIELGRFAIDHRKARGVGRPETFDFLGFTRRCGVIWSYG